MCFHVSLDTRNGIVDAIKHWGKTDLLDKLWKDERWIKAFDYPLLPLLLFDRESKLAVGRWGLVPSWVRSPEQAKDLRAKTLNARSETIFELPSFRESAPSKRCLLPVTAYFEYQHRGAKKIPYRLHKKDRSVFFLAGLWSEYAGEPTFTILTMPANALAAEIHNSKRRMPVVIDVQKIEAWLTPSNAEAVAPVFVPDDTLDLVATEDEGPNPKKSEDDLQGLLF